MKDKDTLALEVLMEEVNQKESYIKRLIYRFLFEVIMLKTYNFSYGYSKHREDVKLKNKILQMYQNKELQQIIDSELQKYGFDINFVIDLPQINVNDQLKLKRIDFSEPILRP